MSLRLVSSHENYQPPQIDNHTQEVFNLWLKQKKSVHTRDNYQRVVNSFLSHANKPIANIRTIDIQNWIDAHLMTVAPATKSNRVAAVKSLLTYAFNADYISSNPGKAIKADKPETSVTHRTLSREQVFKMFAATNKPRDNIILKLLYYAGLRVSELCGLAWRDVEVKADGSAVLTVLGKGGKIRYVKLKAEVTKMLGQPGKPDAPLFISQKGNAISRVQVFRIVKTSASKAIVVGDISPHWLRHSHATHALESGAPITLVRDTLGHSNVSVTNVYLKSNPDQSSGDYL